MSRQLAAAEKVKRNVTGAAKVLAQSTVMFRTWLNRLLAPFELKVVHTKETLLFYQYHFGGIDEYRRVQTAANKQKFHKIFADEVTLTTMTNDISEHGLARCGICHGARNGWEVEWLRQKLGCPVIGTDISDTAQSVPRLIQHDFHEQRDEWIGKFSFVYSNSLDHAYDPKKAVSAWADQLTPDGRIYIEHTMCHSPVSAGREMDPFSAHPFVMPYLLVGWGKRKFRIVDILEVDSIEHLRKDRAWLFVLERIGSAERCTSE